MVRGSADQSKKKQVKKFVKKNVLGYIIKCLG